MPGLGWKILGNTTLFNDSTALNFGLGLEMKASLQPGILFFFHNPKGMLDLGFADAVAVDPAPAQEVVQLIEVDGDDFFNRRERRLSEVQRIDRVHESAQRHADLPQGFGEGLMGGKQSGDDAFKSGKAKAGRKKTGGDGAAAGSNIFFKCYFLTDLKVS